MDIQGGMSFDGRELSKVLWQRIFQLFGEVGASQTGLSWVKGSGVPDQVIVVRCSHKALDMVRAAIAAVTEIDGQQCAIHVFAVSGTLKGLRRKLARNHVHRVGSIQGVESKLRRWLKAANRIVVMGIGNQLRKDDFVGIQIVRSLKDRVSKRVMLVESETTPESFIDPITNFEASHILLIDAGLIGLKSSEVEFFESSEFLGPITASVSTHALPLRIFCTYLEETTDARIGLIVIQPEHTDFGQGLSVAVKRTAARLEKVLLENLPQ